MKRYIILLTTFMVTLILSVACNMTHTQTTGDKPIMDNMRNDTSEVAGGMVDKSYDAPTEIKSRNIESFETYFYIWDQYDEAEKGNYSFKIEKNDSGKYTLSEDTHYNISETIERSVLDGLQKIIDDNSLSMKNGMDKHSNGLLEEFAPCMFWAKYDSGEQLYFSENNDPEAKWAREVKELFEEEFIKLGHDELLPPIESVTLVRFDMGYEDETEGVSYSTIFTEEDTDEISHHYFANVYRTDTKEEISRAIQTIPDNFYEELSVKLSDLRLKLYRNDKITSSADSKVGKYAFFCMEMQNGDQINAYYAGEEAEDLISLLKDIKEFIDGQLSDN